MAGRPHACASHPAIACVPNIHPNSLAPRYVRGHIGVVERLHGCHVFPDTAALDQGENPQWLYTVVFESRELWGDDADPTIRFRRALSLSGRFCVKSEA
jgi:hypothetical protein